MSHSDSDQGPGSPGSSEHSQLTELSDSVPYNDQYAAVPLAPPAAAVAQDLAITATEQSEQAAAAHRRVNHAVSIVKPPVESQTIIKPHKASPQEYSGDVASHQGHIDRVRQGNVNMTALLNSTELPAVQNMGVDQQATAFVETLPSGQYTRLYNAVAGNQELQLFAKSFAEFTEQSFEAYCDGITRAIGSLDGDVLTPRRKITSRYCDQPPEGIDVQKPDAAPIPVEFYGEVERTGRFKWSQNAAVVELTRSADFPNRIQETIRHKAKLILDHQLGRSFVLAISISGHFIQVDIFDRNGRVQYKYSNDNDRLFRLLLTLIYAPDRYLGIDETVEWSSTGEIAKVKYRGEYYRYRYTLYNESSLHGPASWAYVVEKDCKTYTLRDSYPDQSRTHLNGSFLAAARAAGARVPVLVGPQDKEEEDEEGGLQEEEVVLDDYPSDTVLAAKRRSPPSQEHVAKVLEELAAVTAAQRRIDAVKKAERAEEQGEEGSKGHQGMKKKLNTDDAAYGSRSRSRSQLKRPRTSTAPGDVEVKVKVKLEDEDGLDVAVEDKVVKDEQVVEVDDVCAYRRHCRLLTRSIVLPITDFTTKIEFLNVFKDVIESHKILTEKNILHRDFTIRNFGLETFVQALEGSRPPHPSVKVGRGMISSFDHAIYTNKPDRKTAKAPRPTNLLSLPIELAISPEKVTETWRHDLERLFWHLSYLCCAYVGPTKPYHGGSVDKEWNRNVLPLVTGKRGTNGDRKVGIITGYERFLVHFTPYFDFMKPSMRKLHGFMWHGVADGFISSSNITHDQFLQCIEEALIVARTIPEVEEEPEPNTVRATKRKKPSASPPRRAPPRSAHLPNGAYDETEFEEDEDEYEDEG
ncbi:hypothetical protein FA95DRAFT_1612642 [Auriscalpium vulgare]|uniref:Uncharacterized protein n=1 Tax=Auriscalpium vulgare TaxID=40419 RepID=A0ACB8R5D3_9AGAM|nr:hypothetical protein FA95DRAFT_1612642 [Auriscalpium vulgare]